MSVWRAIENHRKQIAWCDLRLKSPGLTPGQIDYARILKSSSEKSIEKLEGIISEWKKAEDDYFDDNFDPP